MKKNRILVVVSEANLPACPKHVNVAVKFDENIKVAFIEDGFGYSFNDLSEGPLPERVLCGYNLCREERDRSLIEFAGEDLATVHLTDLLTMLLKQPNGEPGDLIIDSSANIFYVLDSKKKRCAAIAYWTKFGWCLDVHVITDKNQWLIGNRVFFYQKKLDY